MVFEGDKFARGRCLLHCRREAGGNIRGQYRGHALAQEMFRRDIQFLRLAAAEILDHAVAIEQEVQIRHGLEQGFEELFLPVLLRERFSGQCSCLARNGFATACHSCQRVQLLDQCRLIQGGIVLADMHRRKFGNVLVQLLVQ